MRGAGESIAPVGLGRAPYLLGPAHAPCAWQPCGGSGLDLRDQSNAGGVRLFSGARDHTRVCFDVAANDTTGLALHLAASTTVNGTKLPAVIFALRR